MHQKLEWVGFQKGNFQIFKFKNAFMQEVTSRWWGEEAVIVPMRHKEIWGKVTLVFKGLLVEKESSSERGDPRMCFILKWS